MSQEQFAKAVRRLLRAVCFCEEFEGAALAEAEGRSELVAEEDGVGEAAEWAKGEGVSD